jgi:predicted ABC-class ATPase
MIRHFFSSPENFLNVMSRSDMQEAKEEGERILIDEDGAASVNLRSREVQADFARHVATLCNAGTGKTGDKIG